MGVLMADWEGGERVIYKTKPDLQALKALVDRGMGKVVEKVEITGEEGGAIGILAWSPGPEQLEGEVGEK